MNSTMRTNQGPSRLGVAPSFAGWIRFPRAGLGHFHLSLEHRKNMSRLLEPVARLESFGAAARSAGNETAAEACFRDALGLAVNAAGRVAENSTSQAHLDVLRIAVRLALNCGEVSEARRLMDEALRADGSVAHSEEWASLRDVAAWPDTWLVGAVRRDPPDERALDALAERHWQALFAGCYLLTV